MFIGCKATDKLILKKELSNNRQLFFMGREIFIPQTTIQWQSNVLSYLCIALNLRLFKFEIKIL